MIRRLLQAIFICALSAAAAALPRHAGAAASLADVTPPAPRQTLDLGDVTPPSPPEARQTFDLADVTPPPLPAARKSTDIEKALTHVKAGQWQGARQRAAAMKDPVASKLIEWFILSDSRAPLTIDDLRPFIDSDIEWPRRSYFLVRAEGLLTIDTNDARTLAWFAKHPPLTTAGKVRYAEALLATGHKEEGELAVRDAWVNGLFSKADEVKFQQRHRSRLTADDDVARLDKLLWDGDTEAARRMLWRVKGDAKLVGEARMLLRLQSGNVDAAIAKVPAAHRGDPGLLYERMRWRRAKGLDSEALELLRQQPKDLVRPELWWEEKAVLARRLLQDGYISEAYRLAMDHRLESGIGFAEGEWFAGWIALRFLNDNKVALDHFERMHGGVSYPVSLARAAYWAGRAAEAIGDKPLMRRWYSEAAGQPTTYYGQLAAARLQPGSSLKLPASPELDGVIRKRFAGHELARATSLLIAAGLEDQLTPFIQALGNADTAPAWRRLTAELARSAGRPDLAIRVAKDGAPHGVVLIEEGYPTLQPPAARGPVLEKPLLHALVRQESAFYVSAVSGANARGLMQILPSTAKGVARSLNIPFSPDRLTSDPDYNLTLGQAYLASLLEDFGGSYVLALAAYNAGPGRVRQWIRAYGNPRDPGVDAIDWIEMIPFAETRNYVQRVLENLQVYRDRFSTTEVAENLEADLER